jgi:hypothetical protein
MSIKLARSRKIWYIQESAAGVEKHEGASAADPQYRSRHDEHERV